MRLLVTGFEPFGQLTENPSGLIVEELARRQRHLPEPDPGRTFAVLPTEFDASARTICELLTGQAPDALLALGVAPRSRLLRLERVARNRDSAALPDNAGEVRQQHPIEPSGPDTYASTLPLADIFAALERRDIPVEYSDDAGGYVCNHLFYAARHVIERQRLPTRCGFIHLPLSAEQLEANGGGAEGPRLSLATLVDAVACCIQVVQEMGFTHSS